VRVDLKCVNVDEADLRKKARADLNDEVLVSDRVQRVPDLSLAEDANMKDNVGGHDLKYVVFMI
jgi:hypothetical protein